MADLNARESNIDLTPFVAEIFGDLWSELGDRFDLHDVPEQDRFAIGYAITKGIWRGALRGVALTTEAVNEAGSVKVSPWFEFDGEPDGWADRYGEGAGE
jgi:hypothetical protein